MLSPRATRTFRWLHLWLGVIVGVQIILWVASGLVMVARPLDVVRGTTLRKDSPSLSAPAGLPGELGHLTGIEKLELGDVLGKPVWRATSKDGKRLFDPATGQPHNITAAEAEAIARAGTTLTGKVTVTQVSADDPPGDWREQAGFAVVFPGDNRVYVTTLGEIGAVRTPWWRFYDFFWGLHIMDCQERSQTHGPLLIVATLLALGVVMSGAVLTIRHFWRR